MSLKRVHFFCTDLMEPCCACDIIHNGDRTNGMEFNAVQRTPELMRATCLSAIGDRRGLAERRL